MTDPSTSNERPPPTSSRDATRDLAHDFRNALSIVIGRAQLLAKWTASGQPRPDDMTSGLAEIERAGWRMAREVDRIVNVTSLPPVAGRWIVETDRNVRPAGDADEGR